MAQNPRRKAGPYRVVSRDWSIPGTSDALIVRDIGDFCRAMEVAISLSGPTCRAWVEDAAGRKVFEAWSAAQSA